MEVFLIFPKSRQAQQGLGRAGEFQSEQALKSIQKLPCSTEQKLELVDAAVKHLKAQQYTQQASRPASQPVCSFTAMLCLLRKYFSHVDLKICVTLFPSLELFLQRDAKLRCIYLLRQAEAADVWL